LLTAAGVADHHKPLLAFAERLPGRPAKSRLV
jgi:hypothetical protein